MAMTISKTIEILTIKNRDFDHTAARDLHDSITLGIEALKRFNSMRQDPRCRGFWPLPGETEGADRGQIMNLNRAIEILNYKVVHSSNLFDSDYVDSIKLGIEALKARQEEREHSCSFAGELLPGETEGADNEHR